MPANMVIIQAYFSKLIPFIRKNFIFGPIFLKFLQVFSDLISFQKALTMNI